MKRIKKYITIYLYVFIIFTSTLPNKPNIVKLSCFKNILPGIENLYKTQEENLEKEYSFKFLEFIQKIL